MKKDSQIFLSHILESIDWIEKYIAGLKRDDFFEDKKIQDAVMRRLEIIGEAVKNLSANFKKKYNFIPWQKIAGMRDFLIHEYFGVDVDLGGGCGRIGIENNLFFKINIYEKTCNQ